ncbi:hypothetical protein ACFV5K_06690, partial [Streptomyces sp. NPDC059744]
MNEVLLRSLTPSVLGILVRRGADFAAAEDAVQDALVEAVGGGGGGDPRVPEWWGCCEGCGGVGGGSAGET